MDSESYDDFKKFNSDLNSDKDVNHKGSTSKKNVELPFKLHWVFGYDTKVPPINISSPTIKGIFFTSGAAGICYDWTKKTQTMLLGHINNIISTAATSDKTYLASADSGSENSLIIWHKKTGKMVYILSGHFSKDGVIWMCFSENGNMLLTLTGGMKQELSLWDWKSKKTSPFCTYQYNGNAEFQNEGRITSSVLDLHSLYEEKICQRAGDFTQTVFSSSSTLAYTATTKGIIVLWGTPLYDKKKQAQFIETSLMAEPGQRICLRMMQILTSHCAIPFLGIFGNFIIAGTEQGVCFFDEAFKLQWSIDITEGAVCSVSFNFKSTYTFKQFVLLKVLGKDIKKGSPLERSDFIVSTSNGFAGYIKVPSSEMNGILFGTSSLIKSVAVHPSKPYIYIGDDNGALQKWNYNTKTLINKEVFQGSCTEIVGLSIDSNGNYVACALLTGQIAIFDAVSFDSKPCFTTEGIGHRLNSVKFSPDPQHLIAIDDASYVSCYQLHLLVPPATYQMSKDKVPPEEPAWYYNGKTRQHRGHIVDCMFKSSPKDSSVYFLTLGEDHFVVLYNISNSRKMEINVTRRMHLDGPSAPICMCCYPLYDLREAISIVSDDGKLRVYNLENDEMIRMVSIQSYEESLKRILLLDNITMQSMHSLDEGSHRYIVFHTAHMIGLTKFPIDGNPCSSLAISSHLNGINDFITNKEQTFLFTAGIKDSWIYMYEINFMAIIEAEREGGQGTDAFNGLFPITEDPDEMKRRLVYSVYSLELEMKMLKLGADQDPVLKGEIPVNFLGYVMAALGCFLSPSDLQMMLNDVNFENRYLHDGKKLTLNCLDIMKLYVNYRPREPLTSDEIHQSFKDILSSEEEPDKISRSRFLTILEYRGDLLPPDELVDIVKCLRASKFKTPTIDENTNFSDKDESVDITASNKTNLRKIDVKSNLIKDLIPEIITEEIFFQDILCIEEAHEDLSGYVLKRTDLKLREKPTKVEDFVLALEENKMWQ